MCTIELGNVTLVRLLNANADWPMLTTDAGIVRAVSALWSNELSSINVKDTGKETDVKLLN